MPRATLLFTLVLAAGCVAASSGSGEDTTTTLATDTLADSSDTTGGEPALTHGFVTIELARGEAEIDDPFAGTATIHVTMAYGGCLEAFYAGHADLRQDGSAGALVFGSTTLGGEGWLDRLCQPGGDFASCSIAAIRQQLDPVAQLSLEYRISGALESRTLRFGPLPTSATAGCGDPEVEFSTARGEDADGALLWAVETFDPAQAITDQTGPITIHAARQ